VSNYSEVLPEGRMENLEKLISGLKERIYILEQEQHILEKEKEKFQLIADFSHDWDFWVNSKGEFIWISPSCHDLTGYSMEEFLKDPDLFFSILYPDDEIRFREFFKKTLNFSHIGKSIEFRILTRTKQLRWCELNTNSMFDKMGTYLGQRCSIRDVTRLMAALNKIRQITGEQMWEKKTKERYRNEIAGKDRELVSSLIRIAQQNEIVLYVKRNLTMIRDNLSAPIKKKVAEILSNIDEHLRKQSFNWDDFTLYFEKVHPGFFVRLRTKYPSLSTKDHRTCAYIRLGLTTKEIAGLMNITPDSAEIARIRLRKKLNLDRSENLTTFLQNI
jgi:PAS domain S-box-containing protein